MDRTTVPFCNASSWTLLADSFYAANFRGETSLDQIPSNGETIQTITVTNMAENEASSNVREEFSKLSLDAKASFLVEAVFSTAGTAIHEIGDRLGSLVDLVTGSMQTAASGESGVEDEPSDRPGGSEPSTKDGDEASQ